MMERETYAETLEKTAEKTAEQVPNRIYFIATLASIVISALLFISGRRTWALFFGQWPPTILSLALVSKLLHPSKS
ncbi:MAG: hypothetical protein ACUVX1_11330 [Chloroflexota bacterium]